MNKIERTPIDSDLLRTFVTIAQCGNLTVAAGKLGRTQSAISVQLRKLENGLGRRLFDRTAKGMAISDAGESLLPKAKAILADMAEVATLFAEPLTGSIRVGLPDDFDETILDNVLMSFSQAHPGVQVMAASGCTAGYAAAIQSGDLDVAVCSGPANQQGEALGTEETVWASRRDTALHTQEVLPIAILDRGCWWCNLPTESLEAAGKMYTIVFRSSNFASLQAALRSGFAVGALPKSSIRADLKVLTRKDGLPQLPASRRSILMSPHAPEPLAQAMVDAIRAARLG